MTFYKRCHLKRFDHATRILGFAALVVHWFNPLVWIAFIVSGKDMEMSADEAVIQKMDRDIRAEYSQSLLRFGTVKRMIHVTPLAFGEGDTKSRVKNVLNYKRTAFWVIVIAIVAVVCIGIGLTANQKSNPILTPESDELASVDAKQMWARRPMIMVDGILYLDTEKEVAGNVDDVSVLGQITSAVDVSKKPSEHGQCNFDSGVGAKYAAYEEGMAVLLENKWFFFEKDEDNRQLDYSIMTEEAGAIGCEYGVDKDGKLDALQMLSELEHLNGFQFDTAWASHGYIKFVFHDKIPDNIFLRCIANDMWQQEYPIDSAEYKIKVPPEIGIYHFFADITWKNGEQETAYFSVEVKEHTSIDTIAEYSITKHNKNIDVPAESPLENQELAHAIIMNVLMKSAAWEGVDVSTLEEYYLIHRTTSETELPSDYYVYLLADKTSALPSGTPVVQFGANGMYSVLSTELYEQLAASFGSQHSLFFWVKPDEPPQVIGNTAAEVVYDTLELPKKSVKIP